MYPEIKNHPNKTYREYWLINNLDFSLFTKLSSAAENFLKKGETLDPRNAYITENGEWNHIHIHRQMNLILLQHLE
ncbi:hypothetical protein NW072_03515 [Mycoplasmopsis felis]|uniref:hypothetical protein n=1 Tax=Mycoplasmopsis felis TaxID=33923 RepID=UPI0021B05841|nr:hypothetical protein [Mycoplasmopsis felis]UWV79148.1 hypothetical protein NW072_03515 [Mycoplasmopsis felis]